METQKIVRYSIYINLALIASSLLILVIWNVFEMSMYYISMQTINFLNGTVLFYQIFNGLLFCASFYLYRKGKKKVKGLGSLVLASGVTFLLSSLYVTYGIVTWILAGLSIYYLSKEEGINFLRR